MFSLGSSVDESGRPCNWGGKEDEEEGMESQRQARRKIIDLAG